ncbi:MAG: hypothetical protein HXX19_11860 [Rhodoferax sp.]|nr:hypothetical protein [Rhodoferax sp.]
MGSATDLRQVEIHLTAKGERQVDKLARVHRNELATLPDFSAMPVLAPIQRASKAA